MIHKKVSFHFPKRSSDFAPIFAPRADHRFAKVGPADYPFPGGGSNLLKSCRPPYLCLVPPGEIFSFFVFFGYFLHAHAPPPPRAHARAPRRGSPVAVCVAREGRAAHARDAEGGADAGTPDADGRGTRAHTHGVPCSVHGGSLTENSLSLSLARLALGPRTPARLRGRESGSLLPLSGCRSDFL